MQVKTTNPTATQGPSGGTGPSAGPLTPAAAAGLALAQRNLQKSANPKASDQKAVMKPLKVKKVKNHPNQTGGPVTNAVHPAGHPAIPAQDGNLLDTALMPHLANLRKLAGTPSAANHAGLMEAHRGGVESGVPASAMLYSALRGD